MFRFLQMSKWPWRMTCSQMAPEFAKTLRQGSSPTQWEDWRDCGVPIAWNLSQRDGSRMECLCLQIPTRKKPALRICLGERYGDCCSNSYAFHIVRSGGLQAGVSMHCLLFCRSRMAALFLSNGGRLQDVNKLRERLLSRYPLSAFNLHNPLVIFTGFCNVICYNFLYSLHIYVVYKHSFILCNNVKSIYCRY